MTTSASHRPPFLASALVVLVAVSILTMYGLIYARSTESLARARAAYEQVAWIIVAEPEWRKEYERRLKALQAAPNLFIASNPQEAAGEFQSRFRQALTGAGATIDSLQSSAAAPTEGKLPMIRAVAIARIAATRSVDVLLAIEAIQPRIALESIDIVIQSAGSPQAPERIAVMTLSARAYVMARTDVVD